ncbi:hypothetical protein LSH36_15g15008 [Paralvinella palmiformis]|uniref:Uncharacterized protein n=1 Tax=Paralvinella palmiformis TaxID=53620 RepID=A0AAD9KC86_9ANNE|nr:hypothetical protein LSH36_15g15008 [Paralvinella palmiformis]
MYYTNQNETNLCTVIENDLNVLTQWFYVTNKLSLNVQKNETLFFVRNIVQETETYVFP